MLLLLTEKQIVNARFYGTSAFSEQYSYRFKKKTVSPDSFNQMTHKKLFLMAFKKHCSPSSLSVTHMLADIKGIRFLQWLS